MVCGIRLFCKKLRCMQIVLKSILPQIAQLLWVKYNWLIGYILQELIYFLRHETAPKFWIKICNKFYITLYFQLRLKTCTGNRNPALDVMSSTNLYFCAFTSMQFVFIVHTRTVIPTSFTYPLFYQTIAFVSPTVYQFGTRLVDP